MKNMFFKGFLARKLFNLISKYGMKFVLNGLIEVCEKHEDERMQRLAKDLKTALRHYEGKDDDDDLEEDD